MNSDIKVLNNSLKGKKYTYRSTLQVFLCTSNNYPELAKNAKSFSISFRKISISLSRADYGYIFYK